MWIDTHCHLDAHEFGDESDAVAERAAGVGVARIVIPAIARGNFARVTELSAAHGNCVYALGIHPIFVPQSSDEDLDVLREAAAAALHDSRFVAIGEIGLDFFIPALREQAAREKQ